MTAGVGGTQFKWLQTPSMAQANDAITDAQ
jgi:hypothetical protein